MIDFKSYIIKHFAKFKVVHSIPGRIRLKVSNSSKIPKEAREYDKYVIQGVKILDGIENIEFNYITGSVLINYDTNKVYEEKVIRWINKVLDIVLQDIKLIQEYGETNVDYVVNTIEQKLRDEVKTI
jgi:copper chaperone CopZ